MWFNNALLIIKNELLKKINICYNYYLPKNVFRKHASYSFQVDIFYSIFEWWNVKLKILQLQNYSLGVSKLSN